MRSPHSCCCAPLFRDTDVSGRERKSWCDKKRQSVSRDSIPVENLAPHAMFPVHSLVTYIYPNRVSSWRSCILRSIMLPLHDDQIHLIKWILYDFEHLMNSWWCFLLWSFVICLAWRWILAVWNVWQASWNSQGQKHGKRRRFYLGFHRWQQSDVSAGTKRCSQWRQQRTVWSRNLLNVTDSSILSLCQFPTAASSLHKTVQVRMAVPGLQGSNATDVLSGLKSSFCCTELLPTWF